MSNHPFLAHTPVAQTRPFPSLSERVDCDALHTAPFLHVYRARGSAPRDDCAPPIRRRPDERDALLDMRNRVRARRVVLGPVDRHRAKLVRHGVSPPVQRERDALPEEQVLLRFLLRPPRGREKVRVLLPRLHQGRGRTYVPSLAG